MKKIMIRLASLLGAALLLCTVLFSAVSCSNDAVTTLNVYNWGEYISDGSEGSYDTNKEFEKWYEETYGEKIRVNYTTFASNEDMYAKLKSEAVSYDIVIPSDYMIEQMINEGMLEKLDFANIPNYENIVADYKDLFYDPANEYSVPYSYGMVGVIYNTSVVTGAPQTWSLLWDTGYSGQILTFNNPRDAFGTAMYKMGISVNTVSEEDWRKACDQLKAQKPLIQSYVMDEVFNKMKNGSAAIAPYYAGDFFTMYEDNAELAFYYPAEGTNVFVDAICIPKGTPHKTEAERYINFLLSEEAAVANAKAICYASPNQLVRDNEEYKRFLSELHANAYDILYTQADAVPTEYYHNLPNATRDLMNSLWEELKIESSVGAGVYIVGAVILALIAAAVIFLVIRRKKRQNYDDIEDEDDGEEEETTETSVTPADGNNNNNTTNEIK